MSGVTYMSCLVNLGTKTVRLVVGQEKKEDQGAVSAFGVMTNAEHISIGIK